MPRPDLVFRRCPADAPEVARELARLIRDVFDLDTTPLDRFGRDPDVVSFGWWSGDTLVANLGLARRTLWLAGIETEARDIRSVAVRPAWRGDGLFRDLMTRALAEADGQVGLVTLATEIPTLYAPFGFRPLAESAFLGPIAPTGAAPNHRRLSLADDTDVALIRDLFARRTPVSRLCAVCDHPALFFLKAIESPEIALVHLADLDAVVAIDEDDPAEPALLDVVAPRIPSLAAIAAALGGWTGRIRVAITPDRLDWRPDEIRPETAGHMIRGRFPPEGRPLAFSPMEI